MVNVAMWASSPLAEIKIYLADLNACKSLLGLAASLVRFLNDLWSW